MPSLLDKALGVLFCSLAIAPAGLAGPSSTACKRVHYSPAGRALQHATAAGSHGGRSQHIRRAAGHRNDSTGLRGCCSRRCNRPRAPPGGWHRRGCSFRRSGSRSWLACSRWPAGVPRHAQPFAAHACAHVHPSHAAVRCSGWRCFK